MDQIVTEMWEENDEEGKMERGVRKLKKGGVLAFISKREVKIFLQEKTTLVPQGVSLY